MVGIISGAIALVLIAIIVPRVIISTSHEKECPGRVHLSRMYWFVGAFETLLFLLLAISPYLWPTVVERESPWLFVAVAPFILLGIFLILIGGVWGIRYDDKGFFYRSMWGRRTVVMYCEIIRIKRTKETVHLYTINKHFYVIRRSSGVSGFLRSIAQNVKTL